MIEAGIGFAVANFLSNEAAVDAQLARIDKNPRPGRWYVQPVIVRLSEWQVIVARPPRNEDESPLTGRWGDE